MQQQNDTRAQQLLTKHTDTELHNRHFALINFLTAFT